MIASVSAVSYSFHNRIFEKDGAKVVIDEVRPSVLIRHLCTHLSQTSLELLAGSKIDYVKELVGSSFSVLG